MKKTKKRSVANINEFSWAQMLSNADGKTSASGAMGVFICLIGGICFLIGSVVLIFFKGSTSDILVQSISLVYAGALLLGYRKSADTRAEISGNETPVSDDSTIETDTTQEDKPETKNDAGDENKDVQINS